MQNVLFRDVAYHLSQLPKLSKPLVRLTEFDGRVTELIHPLDCLILGVHNGGYFNSRQSYSVHGLPIDNKSYPVLGQYFTYAEIQMLPGHFHRCSAAGLTAAGDVKYNHFGISASSSLDEWQANGWIQPGAPEGWFEAYTQRAVFGQSLTKSGVFGHRGLRTDWSVEQKRMLSFVARHSGQIRANCPGDLSKRLRQRQALLNWASPLAFM